MKLQTGHTIWACADCYEAHHGLMDEWPDDRVPDRTPLALVDDADTVTSGALPEEHAPDCELRKVAEAGLADNVSCTYDEECETVTFSWSHCPGCGSTLGGTRHALTIWSE